MGLSKTVNLTVKDYTIALSSQLKFYKDDSLMLKFALNEYGIDVNSSFKTARLMPINPLSAKLTLILPNGVKSIESTEIENNLITFKLLSSHTQFIGKSTMQIILTDIDGCKVTLPPFEFEVKETLQSGVRIVKKLVTRSGQELIMK